MEKTDDTIVLQKKDVTRFVIYSMAGIAVIIFGLVELWMILGWGSAHNITSINTPVLYAVLYLMVMQFAAISVFIGIVLFDLGQIKFKIGKVEENIIEEIREGSQP